MRYKEQVAEFFGPKPRSYNQKTNTKVRKLALMRALVDHASDGLISLIEDWSSDSPKTKSFVSILEKIGSRSTTLIIDHEFHLNVNLAARNLNKVKLSKALEVGAVDIVNAEHVICSVKAMDALISKLSSPSSLKS